MYKLFARVEGGHACMISFMSSHLRETGKALVTEDPGGESTPGKNASTYIQSLLNLRDQYNMLLERSFDNSQLFKQSIGVVSVEQYVKLSLFSLILFQRISSTLSISMTSLQNTCHCS